MTIIIFRHKNATLNLFSWKKDVKYISHIYIVSCPQEKLSELVMSNSTEDGKFMVDEEMFDEDTIDLNIGILDDEVRLS